MLRRLTGPAALLIILASAATPALSQTISYLSLDDEVGSGLQTNSAQARLSDDQHGGIVMRIESTDTTLVLVTDDDQQPGSRFVDVFVPNGDTDATFYVQALEDTSGTVTLTASAPGFSNGVDSIEVVQPALRITGLANSRNPYDTDDDFYIQVGVPNGSLTSLSSTQRVRVGGPGLTATVSNSNAAAGQLVTTALTAQVVTVTIAPGEVQSPTTVAFGGVAFDALAEGSTDVGASIPGFLTLSGNPHTVTVTPVDINMYNFPTDVGAGLQVSGRQARLSGRYHGGTVVHLVSSDSSLVLLAADRFDAGSGTLDVFVPDGELYTAFYVQALEDTVGSAAVAATATGFNAAVGTVNVVQPYYSFTGLNPAIDTLDPADDFLIHIGLPNGSVTVISPTQQARGGGDGVTFVITSSDGAVGLLETDTTYADTARVYIPAGESASPFNVDSGGVAFDGVGAGVSTVEAFATDFDPVANGVVDVTVSQPVITYSGFPPAGIGAGLQDRFAQHVNLSASEHGGVTIHLEISDTALAVISDGESTVGAQSLDLFVADGATYASFFIQGKEDTIGVAYLTATAPGFTTGVDSIDIVVPDIRMLGLPSSLDTLDPPNDFVVNIGQAVNTVTFDQQHVRAGSPGVVATITLDDSTLATLQTLPDTSHTVMVTVPALETSSPALVDSGGVALDGLSPGDVEVSVTAPGFDQFSSAVKTVTITAPVTNIGSLGDVGAGLQSDARGLSLSSSAHGGVTVHIESLEPALALVSDGVNIPGTTSIDVFVPDGSTGFQWYVHGVDDTTGVATITSSAPGFLSDTDSVDIVVPGVELNGVPASIDASDSPDEFYALVGLKSGDNSDVYNGQKRRAGAPPLEVTLVSSNGNIAELVKTLENNDTLTVNIAAGNDRSPNSLGLGGVAIDGLASGQTLVTAAIPGFFTVGNGQRTVNVSNQNVYINGLATRLGKDLQSVAASAELGEPNHGGTTVHIEVDDTTRALISGNALVAGADFIDVNLPNGDAEALFYLQAKDTGQVTVTATATSFTGAMQNVDIVPAGVRILSLADSVDITDPDDEFIVQVGAINSDSTDIVVPQEVRGGGPSRTITVASSDGDLAYIVLGNDLDSTVAVTLDPGEFETPSPVSAGGLALTPWKPGVVTVTASTPGFITTGEGERVVTITGTPTGIDGGNAPAVFALEQNFPDPFNPSTTIRFSIPAPAHVALTIYDVAGRRITTLVDRRMSAGSARVQWNGYDSRGQRVASGVYFYRLVAGSTSETRKMVMLK